MAHYVYILRSLKDEKYYIGCTANLYDRLKRHNNDAVRSTKYRRPLELMYSETVPSLKNALLREKRLKNSSRTKIDELINTVGVAQLG